MRKHLYLLVTADTHQVLGAFTDREKAELHDANVASHCVIYKVAAHGD